MFNNTIDKPKFDWNDFVIIPEPLSIINSRKEIEKFNLNKLIMVSPMDTVIDENNYYEFIFNDLEVCMPRGSQGYMANMVFTSMSLQEFESYINQLYAKSETFRFQKILVDIANANLEKLYKLTKEFLTIDTKCQLIIGNIANPETYKLYAELGVYACRVGVGGGSACTTSANTAIHYPMASLIKECYDIKIENNYQSKIIGDGGFKNFDEIIKALYIGADQVMLGSLLNKCIESCSATRLFGIKLKPKTAKSIWTNIPRLRKFFSKSYRGMSTKQVQKKWKRKTLKTAEGISKTNRVEYTLSQWMENFNDYLRSAMSYTNSRTIKEFRESQSIFITPQARGRYAK